MWKGETAASVLDLGPSMLASSSAGLLGQAPGGSGHTPASAHLCSVSGDAPAAAVLSDVCLHAW